MKQQTALDILKTGANVFLTGSAGAGKTYLLNQYIDYLRVRGVSVAVTASTGIAATHLGGMTVHAWSGLGVRESVGDKDLETIRARRGVKERVASPSVVVIDEISMLSAATLECVEKIMFAFRGANAAFGGAQMIFCGDFFQLPPVSKTRQTPREKFAFMSPAWLRANLTVCYLSESHRHTNDELSRLLTQMRAGLVDDEMRARLHEKVSAGETDASAIKLHTHNAPADTANRRMLETLSGDEKHYAATTWGAPPLVQNLTKSVLAPAELTLKKSARVMFVKNNPDAGYMNGTLGEVVGFKKELPMVKTADRVVDVYASEWTVENASGNPLASYRQVPLRLAWAITVHKSQGMTLEKACVNLTNTFEPGQGYVALSRVKTWGGLQMVGYNAAALEMDSFVRKADVRFRALSDEATAAIEKIDRETLQEKFARFITASGGSNDADDIARNTAKQDAEQKAPRKSPPKSIRGDTHRATKSLIEAGKTLTEICTARGLKPETIIGHLRVLRDSHPDLDLSRLQPPPETIDQVRTAIETCRQQNADDDWTDSGALKLSAVRRELNYALDYEDIRLAMVFMAGEVGVRG